MKRDPDGKYLCGGQDQKSGVLWKAKKGLRTQIRAAKHMLVRAG